MFEDESDGCNKSKKPYVYNFIEPRISLVNQLKEASPSPEPDHNYDLAQRSYHLPWS